MTRHSLTPLLAILCAPAVGHAQTAGDAFEAKVRRGESGPAVVPGKPAESFLLRAIRHVGDAPKMPPKGPKLPPAVVADFEAWIAAGAPVPAATRTAGSIDWAAARK